MRTPEASIWLALRARVESLVLSPVYPVAWPNEGFDPTGLLPYIRVMHLPNVTSIASTGPKGYNRHLGILQLTLVTLKNQNLAVPTDLAGTIKEWFKFGTAMTLDGVVVRVEKPPSTGPTLIGETMASTSVSVRYFADVQRT